MRIRKYKPTTPSRRGSSVADFVEITRSAPEKSLVEPLPKKGGRNNSGRITTRHQGGGHKRIEAQHAKGKLTARERIEMLLDGAPLDVVDEDVLVSARVDDSVRDQLGQR